MDLTLRQLRTLREVAACGTIAAAAESLGYTASAVSQQMARLEAVVGSAVLERIGRGVRLTDVGRELLRHTDEVLEKVEAAQAAIEATAATPRGDVRVSVLDSVATSLLPGVLQRLAERHDGVVVRSVELDPDDALEAVASGRIDLAFVLDYPHMAEVRTPGLERQPVTRDEFRLVVPAADGLTAPVDLAEVASRPFIAGRSGTSCRRCVVQACRDAGFEPSIHHEIDQYGSTLRLVAAGAGVALIPDVGLVDVPADLAVLDLARPVYRSLEVAYRPVSAHRPAFRAVLDAIVATAATVGDRGAPAMS